MWEHVRVRYFEALGASWDIKFVERKLTRLAVLVIFPLLWRQILSCSAISNPLCVLV